MSTQRRPIGSAEQQSLAIAIRQRIESRLHGRVRNLVVRAYGDVVMLEGQCCDVLHEATRPARGDGRSRRRALGERDRGERAEVTKVEG